jgi:amino acid permease
MYVGFDPLGFTNWIDVRWLREAELKHSRIAMLAVVGFIGTSFITLPGDVHQVPYIACHTFIHSDSLD